MRPIRFLTVLPITFAVLAAAGPSAAQDYDMDCKLLLCLPGGFPDGCGDAHDHMMDRLGDGKSPIGTCAMAGGGTYDDYEIDWSRNGAASREGWSCPEGTRLHHESRPIEANRSEVEVFCYTAADSVQIGQDTRTYHTGVTRPERTDVTVRMVMNASTEQPYDTGPIRLNTGRASDRMTTILHDP